MPHSNNSLHTVYPVSSKLLASSPGLADPIGLPEFLANNSDLCAKHPYLPDLARIERARYRVEQHKESITPEDTRIINPALELVSVRWHNLVDVLLDATTQPVQGEEFIIVFRKPGTDNVQITVASGHDLLALKLVGEAMESKQAAREGGVSIGTIDDILYTAVSRGILIAPASKITRSANFPHGDIKDPAWFSAPTFTLQWHITQVCDLHCRHCYDRSDRDTMPLDKAITVLDDLYDFCQEHNVFTQVTFTGGNPMLYPHFIELYKEAADRGFMTAILGNPMPRHRIEEMLAIQKPEFYQVSLEGLEEHNDYIRGQGHFTRVFQFLDLLKELDIYSMVMLTLTRLNMGEVLDLAEVLRSRVNLFTFNRLAMVGEGASLSSAPPEIFADFLDAFMQAAKTNPILSLKDNFFNLLRHKQGLPYVGGCAGYGCGAAFNFVSLLPDGEVHACRKLPSPIGNIHEQSLTTIYHSADARKYRAGSAQCSSCSIRPVCGGCLAVSYGFGLDIFTERDPYCWLS
jgi:selenobiotic family peptide radical SAM maturase